MKNFQIADGEPHAHAEDCGHNLDKTKWRTVSANSPQLRGKVPAICVK